MKKFFNLMIAFMAMFAMTMSAQTLESSRFIDNTYFRVEGGVTGLSHPKCNGYENFGHSLQAVIGAEVGKWITPKFGVAFEGDFGLRNGSKYGAYQWIAGTYPDGYRAHTFNYITVAGLAKVNLSNLFGGFKHRTVEFVLATGPTWIHGFPSNVKNGGGAHYYVNDFGVKFKAEVNFNVAKRWQINIIPEFNYNLTKHAYANHPCFDVDNSWVALKAGVTYKFGKEFTQCPYKYTQADVDRLNAEINDLRARTAEPVVKTVVETKVVTRDVPQTVYVVAFDYGKSDLDQVAKDVLNAIPADVVVTIKGEASNPGSAKFNQKLSEARAKAVADYLVTRRVKVADVTGVGATGRQIVVVTIK